MWAPAGFDPTATVRQIRATLKIVLLATSLFENATSLGECIAFAKPERRARNVAAVLDGEGTARP